MSFKTYNFSLRFDQDKMIILVFLLAEMICFRNFDRNIIKIANCFNQILKIFIIRLINSIIPRARITFTPGISYDVSENPACSK
jgi:hypothetical protein